MRWRLRRAPRVSVVIASYRWPEALRISLASALAQTVGDLEVLVVEDGDDPASRDVVAAVRDRRVRRLELTPAAGSQSGPNALGGREACAPVVAYLGHDDVWHPEHLADLLEVLTADVDVVHAMTILLAGGDDPRAAVAGTNAWRPGTFVPPSSIAHRRGGPRVAAWAPAGESGLPVDQAFLVACERRGARFATTGRPTVFKVPAAWRLDSYRTRDVSPQLRLQEQLRADPELGPKLVARALEAGAPPDVPAPPEAAPGVIADYNRRLKGLPARFAAPCTRWVPSDLLAFPGWHAVEQDAEGCWAWTGPGERACVRLDAPGLGDLEVRVVVRHARSAAQLGAVAVELDGERIALERIDDRVSVAVLTGRLHRPARELLVEVGILAEPGRAGDADPRMVGVAVAEIALRCAQPRERAAAPDDFGARGTKRPPR